MIGEENRLETEKSGQPIDVSSATVNGMMQSKRRSRLCTGVLGREIRTLRGGSHFTRETLKPATGTVKEERGGRALRPS